MDTLSYLGQGFGVALTPYNLVTALSGTLIGTVVGLLPGLGPINGVALLIPIAFALGLPPESALILLAAVYLGCEYGGRISSILLNIPGEASTVMTTLDATRCSPRPGRRRTVAVGLEFVHRRPHRHLRHGAVRPAAGEMGHRLRPGGILRTDGVCHRRPGWHGR